MASEIIATEKRIAKTFKYSVRKVRDYFKEARVSPGKYDFLICVEIFVDNSSGLDEKNELSKINREMIELKMKILKEEYHDVEVVQVFIMDIIHNFKNKLLNNPKELVKELKKKDSQDWEEIIENHILKALKELKVYE